MGFMILILWVYIMKCAVQMLLQFAMVLQGAQRLEDLHSKRRQLCSAFCAAALDMQTGIWQLAETRLHTSLGRLASGKPLTLRAIAIKVAQMHKMLQRLLIPQR